MTVPSRADRRCLVFLAGEGPTDIGGLADEPPHSRSDEGFLQPLLRALVGPELPLSFEGRKLSLIAGKRRPYLASRGHAAKARQAILLAAEAGAAALVYCADVDRTQGRRSTVPESRKRMANLRKEIEEGLESARKQLPAATRIVTVVATPCRMLEAWALGDREALREAFDGRIDETQVPSRPEELWGDEKNAQSHHPKFVLRRVVSRRSLGHHDFARISAKLRPQALEASCPTSFGTFAAEVRRKARGCRRGA